MLILLPELVVLQLSGVKKYRFNKEGVKFYNGWDGAPAEEARYRFLSAPMKVSGSGIMSVKMGGHSAELQIL